MRKKSTHNPCNLVLEIDGKTIRGTAAQLHEVNTRGGGWDKYLADRDLATARKVAHTVAHQVAEAVVSALMSGAKIDTENIVFGLSESANLAESRVLN